MEKVFEDVFMDIQTRMIELCLELAQKIDKGKPDMIYVYGSLEEHSVSFNAFYRFGNKIVSASKLANNMKLTSDFLQLGGEDLCEIISVCKKYDRPIPTELKLYYDCTKNSMDAKYRNESVCNEKSGLTPAAVFIEWQNMIRTQIEEGDKTMKNNQFLPLGSIVILEGGIQKMLIISRALNVNNGGQQYYFDYGAVPYPEGLVSDRMAYFNADAISRVVFEGYRDVDDEAMVDNIRRYIDANPDRLCGDPKTWQV